MKLIYIKYKKLKYLKGHIITAVKIGLPPKNFEKFYKKMFKIISSLFVNSKGDS